MSFLKHWRTRSAPTKPKMPGNKDDMAAVRARDPIPSAQKLEEDAKVKLEKYLKKHRHIHLDVAVFGKAGIGKHRLAQRLVDSAVPEGKHRNNQPDIFQARVPVYGRTCTLSLAPGHLDDTYEVDPTVEYYDYAIYVFDVTNPDSFIVMQRQFHVSSAMRQRMQKPIPWSGGIVIALTNDRVKYVALETVNQKDAESFAQHFGSGYMIVSTEPDASDDGNGAIDIAQTLLLQRFSEAPILDLTTARDWHSRRPFLGPSLYATLPNFATSAKNTVPQSSSRVPSDFVRPTGRSYDLSCGSYRYFFTVWPRDGCDFGRVDALRSRLLGIAGRPDDLSESTSERLGTDFFQLTMSLDQAQELGASNLVG